MTGDTSEPHELDASPFSSWLSGMQDALRGEADSDVPCGGCTACCTSSQFIHIAPDEAETLAHISGELLFPAPGRPRGHVLMGYDENGHCPMLTGGRCSIYAHRPRTYRTYDCRVLPAVGVEVGDDDKASIARQARRWQFDFPTELDRAEHAAVQAAGAFLQANRHRFANGVVPSSPTQLAVLAIEIHDAFLELDDETGLATVCEPHPAVVEEAVLRRTRPRDRS